MSTTKKIKRKAFKYIFKEDSNHIVSFLFLSYLEACNKHVLCKNALISLGKDNVNSILSKFGHILKFFNGVLATLDKVNNNENLKVEEKLSQALLYFMNVGESDKVKSWLEAHACDLYLYSCDNNRSDEKYGVFSYDISIDVIDRYMDLNNKSVHDLENTQIKLSLLSKHNKYCEIVKIYLSGKTKVSLQVLIALAKEKDGSIEDLIVSDEVSNKLKKKFLFLVSRSLDSDYFDEKFIYKSIVNSNRKNKISGNKELSSLFIEIICKILFERGDYKSTYKISNVFLNFYAYNPRLVYLYAASSFMIGGEKKVRDSLSPIFQSLNDRIEVLWKVVVQSSTLMSRSILNETLRQDSIDRLKEYSIKIKSKYFFDMMFCDSSKGILEISNRSNFGYRVFPKIGDRRAKSNLYFCSIKNINYAYILSNAYSSYPAGSGVICDNRFKIIFERTYPHLKFYGVSRPQDTRENLPKWYGSDYLDELSNSFRLFISQPLNIDSIISNRDNGWLVSNESCVVRKNVIKNNINIGLSVGTGVQTGLRGYNNIPLSLFKDIASIDGVKFFNLDYFGKKSELEEYNISTIDFDLKNDMDTFGDLISSLDLVICIPNNIMDACAAYGTRSLVFDPLKRNTYWGQGCHHLYYFSNMVEFVSGDDKTELLSILKTKVKNFIYEEKSYKAMQTRTEVNI